MLENSSSESVPHSRHHRHGSFGKFRHYVDSYRQLDRSHSEVRPTARRGRNQSRILSKSSADDEMCQQCPLHTLSKSFIQIRQFHAKTDQHPISPPFLPHNCPPSPPSQSLRSAEAAAIAEGSSNVTRRGLDATITGPFRRIRSRKPGLNRL